MLVFDAVILNEDRHFGNFGFLIDNKSNKIVGCAPIFDNGVSLLCYAMDDNFKNIDQYIQTRLPATYQDFITFVKPRMTKIKKEKLRKLIKKDNIKQVACEEEIQQYVDKKILIDEKDIIKYLILEILEYIFEIQGKKMEQEDIYFLINKDEDIYLENIKVTKL